MSFPKPDIQVFAMVLGYQRRYWWQCSSILQQVPYEGNEVPRIQCVASVSERDPWFEWNHELLRVFRDQCGLDLVLDVWHRDDVRYGGRGHVRTRNLQQATAKHVMWCDADQCYHPQFFAKQQTRLLQHAGEHRVMALGRRSMAFEHGYALVEQEDYKGPVQDAYRKANTTHPTWLAAGGRAAGAGFHQVIDLQAVKGFAQAQGWPALEYVPSGYGRDNNIVTSGTVQHCTRSDRQFRIRVGGVVPLSDPHDDVLTGQVHINHNRRQDPNWDPRRHH